MRPAELETPIFLGARRRLAWLRWAGVAGAVVILLWLAALVAGVLGFGNVTGLRLPGAGGSDSPVLHRAPGAVTTGITSLTTAAGARGPGSGAATAQDGRARPAAGGGAPGRPRRARRARGVGGAAPRPVRAGRTPVTSAPAGAVAVPTPAPAHGRGNGTTTGGAGGTTPSATNPHHAAAPGQQGVDPGAPGPRSPNAHANRTTTTG